MTEGGGDVEDRAESAAEEAAAALVVTRVVQNSNPACREPGPKKKTSKRTKSATQRRLLAASQKRALERQVLVLEPGSKEAEEVRRRRRRRAKQQGMKRASENRSTAATRAVGRPRVTPHSGQVSWIFEDRVQALMKNPDELFRVLPTVYGASDTTPCTFEAFNRLRDGKWFTDEVVNYYFAALGQQALDPAQVAIVSSYFYCTLKRFGPQSAEVRKFGRPNNEKHSNAPGLLRGELLLIPINWYTTHWGLVSVHPVQKRIRIWDSLRNTGMTSSLQLRQLISDWIENEQRWRGEEHTRSEWRWEVMDVPQQTNSYDCGVYLCSFAASLVRLTEYPVTDKGSAKRFRAEMLISAVMAAVGKH